jgi:hypothetical protein
MEFRLTRHQVPRGTRPDAMDFNAFYLFKNVSRLAATYQIRLLAHRAAETGKKLILRVPGVCEVQPSLKRLIKDTGKVIFVEKV